MQNIFVTGFCSLKLDLCMHHISGDIYSSFGVANTENTVFLEKILERK